MLLGLPVGTYPLTVIFQGPFFAVALTMNVAEIVPVPVTEHTADWAKVCLLAGLVSLVRAVSRNGSLT